MDRREVETPLGQVVLWGRDTGRPVLLVIPGLFAKPGAFEHLQNSLAAVDVWRAFLDPEPDGSVEGFASQFSAAVASLRRPLGVVGVSAGALVALAMKGPSRLALFEPVLRPALAWPLRLLDDAAWADQMLGRRDFSSLLSGLAVPAVATVGDRPLHPNGPLTGWPSLVDPETRAELEAHPLVTLRTVSGGHDLARDNPAAFFQAVGELALDLAEASERSDAIDASGVACADDDANVGGSAGHAVGDAEPRDPKVAGCAESDRVARQRR